MYITIYMVCIYVYIQREKESTCVCVCVNTQTDIDLDLKYLCSWLLEVAENYTVTEMRRKTLTTKFEKNFQNCSQYLWNVCNKCLYCKNERSQINDLSLYLNEWKKGRANQTQSKQKNIKIKFDIKLKFRNYKDN